MIDSWLDRYTAYVIDGEGAFIEHKLRELAGAWDIAPVITQDSLTSTSKFANARYITAFDKEDGNIYKASNTTITVTRGAIPKT